MPDVTTQSGLTLRPFRAVRYDPSTVSSLAAVTSPPYDLIDEDALKGFMADEPHNIVRLILPQQDYREAAGTLRSWLDSGVLTVDADPALYVYEETGREVLQRGLIGAVGVHGPGSRVILPHEEVYPGPIRDRLALMSAMEANLEPIFLLYEGGGRSVASRLVDEVASSSAAPLLKTSTGDDVRHRLWAVRDPAVHEAVAADLRDRQALIADGHHRYATYQALRDRYDSPGPWDYGLALLVDSVAYPPRLGAIHRVVVDLCVADAVWGARKAFRVEKAGRNLAAALDRLSAQEGTAFLLGGDGELHLLTDPDPAQVANAMPPGASARWCGLDTAVLHELLIPRIWGIPDNESNVRIVHHDAAQALAKAQRRNGTAVILNPLKVPDVLAVAAGGEKVPRKSTSFGPKPRTGLVLRTFAAG